MSCEACEDRQDGSQGIYYFRVSNKEIRWANVGVLCCPDHAQLVRELLHPPAEDDSEVAS